MRSKMVKCKSTLYCLDKIISPLPIKYGSNLLGIVEGVDCRQTDRQTDKRIGLTIQPGAELNCSRPLSENPMCISLRRVCILPEKHTSEKNSFIVTLQDTFK
jgi:hypothetical protein